MALRRTALRARGPARECRGMDEDAAEAAVALAATGCRAWHERLGRADQPDGLRLEPWPRRSGATPTPPGPPCSP